MTELVGIARFKFHEGKVEEFKRLSARCMQIVRVSGEVLGEPSAELRAKMAGGPVGLFTPFMSM